jgi:chemotaxis protein MotB
MRLLLATGVAIAACVLMGCTAGGSIGGSGAVVDSLQTTNARLRAQNRALRDSLRFRKDLETGQYYRERRTLQDRLNRLTYEVRLLRGGGMPIAQLPADSLFATPDSLSDEGVTRLQRIARQLRTTYPNRTVRVEGHADSSPLGGQLKERYGSNWGLSCARATTITRRLIGLSDLEPGQFIAVGYGSTRPRYANDTAMGRRRNRRVRITVLPLPRDYSRPFELSW